MESLFVVTVHWEYTVIPRFHTRHFACVSDTGEYRDLVEEYDGTSAWFFTPKGGIDATTKDAFEVVPFTVEGEEPPIRRAEKKTGQIYTVSLGADTKQEQPVRLAYTYRMLTAERGHLLYIDVEQPTRGIEVELEYSDCNIERVSVLDLIAKQPVNSRGADADVGARTLGAGVFRWVGVPAKRGWVCTGFVHRRRACTNQACGLVLRPIGV